MLYILPFIRTDGHGEIDLDYNPDQEKIFFIGSETLPFTCYTLSEECARISRICIICISAFIRTDGHGEIDLDYSPDQKHIFFIGSETLPSTCYILFGDERGLINKIWLKYS